MCHCLAQTPNCNNSKYFTRVNFYHYFPAVWKCRTLPTRKNEDLTYSYLPPFPDGLPVCVSKDIPAVSGETLARPRACTLTSWINVLIDPLPLSPVI
jgi:hypothetical protein